MADQTLLRARIRASADGCYEAGRAAALAGVPLSTVYHWARTGIVMPSVSPTREKLWSYSDLMALRIVSWLRHVKPDAVPASPMARVRDALALVAELGVEIWGSEQSHSPMVVDQRGEIFVRADGQVLNSAGQPTLLPVGSLDLIAPFSVSGAAGPDLVAPRPHLRIVPARVAGEPHLYGSRITTNTLSALAEHGYTTGQIAAMYEVTEAVVVEAIDLESQLALTSRAAA